MQPFMAYNTPTAATFTVSSETTFDWTSDTWSIPVDLKVAQVTKLANQPVSLGGGLRYWAATTDNGPEGFGFRVKMTFLFPTGGR